MVLQSKLDELLMEQRENDLVASLRFLFQLQYLDAGSWYDKGALLPVSKEFLDIASDIGIIYFYVDDDSEEDSGEEGETTDPNAAKSEGSDNIENVYVTSLGG